MLITDGNVFHHNDGSNCEDGISITLKQEDDYILSDFLASVQSSTKLTGDGRGCSAAAVRSNKMSKALSKYGVVPKKTDKTFLPQLSPDLMPHLIRGILDGDGCIQSRMQPNGKHRHIITFCGSKRLMDDLKLHFTTLFDVSPRSVYSYDKLLSEVGWTAINDMHTIGEYLYKDATIFLTRKHDKYLDFKNHYGLL